MKRRSSFRALRYVGMAAILASAPTAAISQVTNPLGVEWVGGSDTARTPAPRDGGASAAPAPTASNPLGVEWVGGSSPPTAPFAPPSGVRTDGGAAAKPAPAPTSNNPLGVEWMGGERTSTPLPSPTGGNRADGGATTPQPSSPAPQPPSPQPPQPQSPAPQTPVRPEPPAPPPTEAAPGQQRLASVLIDTWLYQAVAFTGAGGTVSETRSVSGTLKFKVDGQYEQALSIGGIANVIKGGYRVFADRLETTYVWRGDSVTDVFDLYLDPTGKRLTLTGRGSPKSHYTLQRAE